MPIYEYTCNACQTRFDQLQRTMSAATDDGGPACPHCGSPQTARALSLFPVSADTAGPPAPAPAMCGCGRVPGSCGGMG